MPLPFTARCVYSEELVFSGVFASHVAVGAQVIVVADGTLPTHAFYWVLETDVAFDMGMQCTCVCMDKCVWACMHAYLSVYMCQCL